MLSTTPDHFDCNTADHVESLVVAHQNTHIVVAVNTFSNSKIAKMLVAVVLVVD